MHLLKSALEGSFHGHWAMADVTPNLIPIIPRLPVTVSGTGGLGPVHAWAIQAGPAHMVLDLEESSRDGAPLNVGTGYRVSGAGFEFDVELLPATNDFLTIKLSHPAQQAALAALVGSQRKMHHIEICENRDVESSDRDHGLRAWSFMPCALPDLAWSDLDTSAKFLGASFAAPVLITGMTGGIERGRSINHNLARAAAAAGIPMGVGSQRLALDDPRFSDIFNVKTEVPGVFLIGNIGAAQLVNGRTHREARELCLRAVEMIEADALAIHINVLQELIQPEGDRDFRGVFDCIAELTKAFPVPVLVKEVGAGMDPQTAKRLAGTGVRAIDVGGRGGTSWGWIEGLRSADPQVLDLAQNFRDWGLTTGEALTLAREAICQNSALQLIATGGIRTGIDVAKAVALGATMAGIGLPLFRAALKGTDEVEKTLDQIIKGLKTVMMCTGSRTLSALTAAIRPGAQ